MTDKRSAVPPDRRQLLAGMAGFAAAAGLSPPLLAGAPDVDLALVLAADCSGSVSPDFYMLQQQGYADAFRSPDVIKAIRSGIHGGIAVCYIQWSGYSLQTQVIPWTLLKGDADIAAFAGQMQQAGRGIYGGGTSPAGAIRQGRLLLGDLQTEGRPFLAVRRVIDVSGDGRTNVGPAPDADRAEAMALGITINGLPILHMEPDIDEYYAREVIGGPGAFIVPARSFDAFREAIRRKLILEIAGRPVMARPAG
ncbi:DUF1194 domain-containing protein [Ferrovibrio sp.]|uniref:DUF1194 domain-containing protein n=1 Tax=Ferrovibrio sp. TaxID=1917215 RepID=UPI00311D7489